MKYWHSINCAHIGIFNQSSIGDTPCRGCDEMRAAGIEPQRRQPTEPLGYGRLHRFSKGNRLDDNVAGKVDRERRLRPLEPEDQYERLMLERDRMGASD